MNCSTQDAKVTLVDRGFQVRQCLSIICQALGLLITCCWHAERHQVSKDFFEASDFMNVHICSHITEYQVTNSGILIRYNNCPEGSLGIKKNAKGE